MIVVVIVIMNIGNTGDVAGIKWMQCAMQLYLQ